MVQQGNKGEKKEIIVYNGVFFALSETFIYRQVIALSQMFSVSLLTRVLQNNHAYNFDRIECFAIGFYVGIYDRLITAFKRHILRKRLIFSIQQEKWLDQFLNKRIGKGILHAHFGWSGLEMLPYVKQKNIPLVVSFHGRDASGELLNNDYTKNLPSLFEYASAIIICSNDMKGRLGLASFHSKTHVVPYGVDTLYFTPSFIKPPEKKPASILHVGRLTGKKGVPDLIKVFSEIVAFNENVILNIIGDGEDRSLCVGLIQKLELMEKVFLLGAQMQSEIRKMYDECDVFVLNSRISEKGDMEGFPNVILEAMSMAKPVVSTYHAGIADAVLHNETGLLVPEKDNKALKEALLFLIENDDERKRMGNAARDRVQKHFSLPVMQQKLGEIFSNISTERH